MDIEIYMDDDLDLEGDDVEYPQPHSLDDPWWSGARSDW